ncbi:DUF2800 domain-containing protein [Geomicrobium sediminis]|uniref:DUF2800 domain-containing protein n=1 Tax=Geomicrobium sediminis TaxID=1347788 RepID=A0ABS2P769_9BACL|nr:DUF2800 domain-containing protein [Geomicrobium sediminis]MBM7631127.1 hypothetical protein [Geomicrobium sediminis]
MIAEQGHAARAHALLSASGAVRWLNCPPSARLEEGFADTTSDHAKIGTLAHEIAEIKLHKQYTAGFGQKKYDAALAEFVEHGLYDEEMLEHTDAYLNVIKDIVKRLGGKPHVAIEQRVSYDKYAPEGFGTSDTIVVGDNAMYVVDFKYGTGVPVSAEDNPQAKLYALGAYEMYGFLSQIDEVHMVIVQPRLFDEPSHWSISTTDLLSWGESIKPVAEQAFKGEGTFNPGEHCGFCRARFQCRARAEQFSPLKDFGDPKPKPDLMTHEEVGKALEIGKHLAPWVKDLEKFALSESLNGKEVPGFKAVHGRGSRAFVDQDKAFEHLQNNGYDESVLYDKKPLSVAQLEKMLGKKDYRKLLEEEKHVENSPGKPTLAPESDKRVAITHAPAASEDFQ